MIDELYCGACGCHFYEDEVTENALLQDVCPHCGSTCIFLTDTGDAEAWQEMDEPPDEPPDY